MNPGDMLTVEVSAINSEGEGIARHSDEGFIIFIPGALPDEQVKCRITKVSKKYATASVVEIIKPSGKRVKPLCHLFSRCGGCQLQHTTYSFQLEIKARILSDALSRIGKISLPKPLVCHPSPKEWGYRNKTTLPVQGRSTKDGKSIICGYYERRSHKIVPFTECPILDPELGKALKEVITLLSSSGLSGYNEIKNTGDIRHIAARTCSVPDGTEILTGMVSSRELSAREFGRLRNMHQELALKNPHIIGSAMNIKTDKDNFIWGPLFRTINGKRVITQHLGEYKFEIDISSFFQINTEQTEILFSRVKEMLQEAPHEKVLELYCGVGSLTAYLADCAAEIDAVEEWGPAVRHLKGNMELNNISGVKVYQDSAENFMQKMMAAKSTGYDTIVLDPPRTGCDERVIEGIKHASPGSIIYISCNPATLARDVSRLISDGEYQLTEIEAFDMFPQTAHVESIARICKRTVK